VCEIHRAWRYPLHRILGKVGPKASARMNALLFTLTTLHALRSGRRVVYMVLEVDGLKAASLIKCPSMDEIKPWFYDTRAHSLGETC
jgi:hypothetical protein